MVHYVSSTINGRQLGHDEPIQVREGQQVLFHILNASATEPHWLTLPGHKFQVLALDGRPVATQASVETLRLGPAERLSALIAMTTPGVWISASRAPASATPAWASSSNTPAAPPNPSPSSKPISPGTIAHSATPFQLSTSRMSHPPRLHLALQRPRRSRPVDDQRHVIP